MNPVPPPEQLPGSGVDLENPWPGLVSFTEELQGFFHGRDEETDELQRRVERKDLTVLFGQSGLGKSSLLQAGLFPRLRAAGYLPVSIRLDHAPAAPPLSEQVKAAVTRVIVESGGVVESTASDSSGSLWEYFHQRSLRLETADGQPVRLVLVFDQFEELFAIGQASEESRNRAAHFLTELADLFENRAPEAVERRLEESPELARQFVFDDRDYRALVCLREDYLPHLESLRQSIPSIAENRMRLTRMNGLKALESVINPGGRLITPEVGRQVVRFVAGGRMLTHDPAGGQHEDDGLAKLEVEPSLLSLVCRELNNRRLALGAPQITADLLAGNRERILHDYYERCLADQPPAVRAFVEDELVTDSGLRENIALERARKVLMQHGASASAIDELVKRRLLHLEERLDIQRVELTHDVLTTVVKKSRDERQQQEATLRAEQEAREVREKARRQRNRLRFIMVGMAVVLAVVSGFGAVSFYQYRVSQERFLEAERQKERADRSFDEARGTVDELLVEMSQEGLKDLPGLQELRQRFAQKAVDRYEVYVTRRPDDASVNEGHARSLAALGVVTGQVGSFEKAVESLEKAIQIRKELLARQPMDLHYQFQLAQARVDLAELYRAHEEKQKARPHVEQAIRELEVVLQQENAPLEHRLALPFAYNVLGNVTEDEIAAVPHFEKARDLAQALYQQYPEQRKPLDILMPPIGNLARLARIAGNYQQALELEDRFLDLLEQTRKRFSLSPNQLGNRGIAYDNKARIYVAMKRPEQATAAYKESVASFRSAVRENPLVGRFQWLLADELRNQASHLGGRGQFAEAQSLYEESCTILDALTQRNDDRPLYAAALVESWVKLAQFHGGGKGDQAEDVASKQHQLRCFDEAVKIGRKFSKKYPDDPNLHFEFGEALYRRANFDLNADRHKEAYPFYEECVETFRTRVCAKGNTPTDYQLGQFLQWASFAQQCAQKLKRGDDVIRLGKLAYDLGKGTKANDGIESLGSILSRSAEISRDAGQFDEAVASFSRAVEILKPGFEKSPWHWYIRSRLSTVYTNLAETHAKRRDFHKEVLAWREHLKIWLGPMQGMVIDDYVNPKRPTNEAEAVRLRQFVKSAPGMRQFTISAEFSGVKYPLKVYITNVPWPKDPLEDQARWLKEERGGTIPEETRATFRNWHKQAYQNNVGFVQFCAAASISDERKAELEATLKKHAATVAVLADKLKNKPKDSDIQEKLSDAYQLLADTHLRLANTKEAIAAYEQSRQLLETITRNPSSPVERLEELGTVYYYLGNIYSYNSVKDYNKSFAMYQHHQEVYERLSLRGNPKPAWRAATLRGCTALGLLCGKAFSPNDAAVWFLKAIEQNHTDAIEGLAALYLEHPEVAEVVPADIKSLLLKVAKETNRDPRTFPKAFVDARKLQLKPQRDARIAQLGELANQYHDLAEVYEGKKRFEDYRKVLIREFDTRGQLLNLDRTNQLLHVSQGAVAGKIARSYLKSNEAARALEWLQRAADLKDVESLLQLGDWYEKGTHVKRDETKATDYRFVGYTMRGATAFDEKRYQESLADLLKASELGKENAGAHERLGMCYGKLARWDDAIRAYTRSIELNLNGSRTTGVILNLCEALIVAERPEQLLKFTEGVEKKGWQLPTEGAGAALYNALYHGFRAIALRMNGQDASEAELKMRQITGKPGTKLTGWGWDELDGWLKTTKITPDRKAAVEMIIAELKGKNPR